jgi:hypothetical protein
MIRGLKKPRRLKIAQHWIVSPRHGNWQIKAHRLTLYGTSHELSNSTAFLNAVKSFEAAHSDGKVRLCCPLLNPLSRGGAKSALVPLGLEPLAPTRFPLVAALGLEMVHVLI